MSKTIVIDKNAAHRSNRIVYIRSVSAAYRKIVKSINNDKKERTKDLQQTNPQALNLPKKQNIASDSLTERAIQAFLDTEDEWAEVYANLAKS